MSMNRWVEVVQVSPIGKWGRPSRPSRPGHPPSRRSGAGRDPSPRRKAGRWDWRATPPNPTTAPRRGGSRGVGGRLAPGAAASGPSRPAVRSWIQSTQRTAPGSSARAVSQRSPPGQPAQAVSPSRTNRTFWPRAPAAHVGPGARDSAASASGPRTPGAGAPAREWGNQRACRVDVAPVDRRAEGCQGRCPAARQVLGQVELAAARGDVEVEPGG